MLFKANRKLQIWQNWYRKKAEIQRNFLQKSYQNDKIQKNA